MSDILDGKIVNRIWDTMDKNTPQIMLTVKFTTKTPPKDTSDVVKLTKDENAVYVKCIIENQGQTDIPQIKIQKHTLHCKPLYCKYNKHNNHKQKYKHIFYIKMRPASRKLSVIAQNSHNKPYLAIYNVTYYPQSNTTNIASSYEFSRIIYGLGVLRKKLMVTSKKEKNAKKPSKPHLSKTRFKQTQRHISARDKAHRENNIVYHVK